MCTHGAQLGSKWWPRRESVTYYMPQGPCPEIIGIYKKKSTSESLQIRDSDTAILKLVTAELHKDLIKGSQFSLTFWRQGTLNLREKLLKEGENTGENVN